MLEEMKMFLEGGRLNRSGDFRLISENGAFFLVHRSGKRILTDKIGRAVWEALPQTSLEVVKDVQSKCLVSARLVQEFLYIFLCSGLVRKQNSENQKPLVKEQNRGAERNHAQEELVSVIVITYNGAKYIRRCLESIQRQTYSRIEIIAVDNDSSDNTADLIRKSFPDVHLFRMKKNRHYAGGINFGIRKAGGRFIMLLNQDTELDRECIRRLYQKARSDSRIGAVAPLMKFMELPGFINGLGNQINNHGWGTDNFIYCVDIGQFEDLTEIPSACFGAVFLGREALESVGLPDKGYGSFYEDVDWSLRCWLRGWKIVPEARAVVYHEFGASYPSGKKLFFVVRNRLRLVLKIFRGRVMLGFLKNYMREDLRNSLSLLRRGDFRAAFCYGKAYFSLALRLPGIFLKRIVSMRRKIKGMRERDVLQKNPSFYCCLHAGLDMPEIDAAVIRRYYRWHML